MTSEMMPERMKCGFEHQNYLIFGKVELVDHVLLRVKNPVSKVTSFVNFTSLVVQIYS